MDADGTRSLISASALLAERLAADPSSAFITAYDDGTADNDMPGERIELSATSFANWVFKTANLLVDGLGAGAGDRVLLALPLHWQMLVWTQACWAVGIEVVLDEDASELTAAVTTHDRARAGFAADADELVALALLPLARPHPDPVPGFLDADREIPLYGDRFAGPQVEPTDVALTYRGEQATFTDILIEVRDALQQDPLDDRSRIAVVAGECDLRETVLHALVVPLLVGGGVVLQTAPRPDEQTWTRRLDQERASDWPITANEQR